MHQLYDEFPHLLTAAQAATGVALLVSGPCVLHHPHCRPVRRQGGGRRAVGADVAPYPPGLRDLLRDGGGRAQRLRQGHLRHLGGDVGMVQAGRPQVQVPGRHALEQLLDELVKRTRISGRFMMI